MEDNKISMTDKPIKVSVDGKEVILVGTAHVSKKSIETVAETISKEKPDVVCVELCKDRLHAMLEQKKWDATDIEKVLREGKIYLFLIQVLLSNFQRRIGEELGVKPGAEMLAAINTAKDLGIPIELVDRDVRITLKRAIQRTSLSEKLRFMGSLFTGFLGGDEEIDEKLVEDLKGEDMISQLLAELGEEAPSVKEVLVDERNKYIAHKIRAIDAKKMVVVVGAGHLKGIEMELSRKVSDKTAKQNLAELETISEKKSSLRIVGYLIPAVFVGIVLWGFLTHGSEVTLRMLWRWFIVNGTLSAFGTAIAGGHPYSILTAFLAAPFTSLNPTIAAGWFAGFVELKVRRPRVADFKGLFKLKSVWDWRKNRVTKILLVVALANIGSTAGTFIALPYLASLI